MNLNAEEKEKLISELQKNLEAELFTRHGPLLTGDALLKALGYSTHDAMRMALVKKTTVVPIFTLEKRKGKFALVKEVARHLAEQRYKELFVNGGDL